MAKTKQKKKSATKQKPTQTAEQLYTLATECADQLDFEQAQSHAQSLMALVDPQLSNGTSKTPVSLALPALNLLGEISIELGDEAKAREYFTLAATADPDGSLPEEAGGGAGKFLWLAQLSEEGGKDSLSWFEKGISALKVRIAALEAGTTSVTKDLIEVHVEDKRRRVADALCSVADLYMTDLSWEADAEQQCETLVFEAMQYGPEDPSVWQTLASIRLSQVKLEEARSALTRSMAIWKDLDPDDDAVPDFATRVSLARLLMEAELEEEAMIVLERLSLEDDQSVEACYLGGWCLYLMAQKQGTAGANGTTTTDTLTLQQASWKWLQNTIKLYDLQQYEDVNLRQHTAELLESMQQDPAFVKPAEGADEELEEWVDDEDSGDEEMAEQ